MGFLCLSAGIGRTGVFISLDALLQQVEREGVIDVQGCIKGLREDRIDMVQQPVSVLFMVQ